MFRKLVGLLAIVMLVGGGWALYHQTQIHSIGDAIRLATTQVQWLTSSAMDSTLSENRATIKIASFNLRALGEDKLQQPATASYLSEIIRQFDVLALQEIRTISPETLNAFVAQVNVTGRHYALIVSDPLGRSTYQERYAFMFDEATIQLDGHHTYVVGDPDDVLRREPLVGWFRCRQADAAQAFTFSLVDVHLDSRRPQDEIAYLAQLFRAIRTDGRGEDDVIIAGDFNADERHLAQLQQQAGLVCLIKGIPTNVRLNQQYDNLLVDPLAASEYTGRSGALDFLRRFNLALADATAISDHLPVWAEFSVLEGNPQVTVETQGR